MVSIREVAGRFAELLGREPVFVESEAPCALLSDASAAIEAFGPPQVGLDRIVEWTASWVGAGRPTHGKPTRYDVRDGTF